jgi:four helix bundle protein
MTEQAKAVLDKTVRFSVGAIELTPRLPQNAAGWTIARQLIRCSTSVGANFQEAQYARSRTEFASKIRIALQEASESRYWLEVVKRSNLGDTRQLDHLIVEADQLVSILVSVCKATKGKS